jgi:hypothetical protein
MVVKPSTNGFSIVDYVAYGSLLSRSNFGLGAQYEMSQDQRIHATLYNGTFYYH